MSENTANDPQTSGDVGGEASEKGSSWWRKLVPGKGTVVALLIFMGATFLRYDNPDFVERIRMTVFDYYNQLQPREPMNPSPVVIVDLDEKSLGEIGQWPWPRTDVADLVAALRDYGAAVVGFDVVFSEPDRTNPQNIADKIRGASPEVVEELKNLKSNDQVLVETIQTMRTVLGQAGTTTPQVKEIPETAYQTSAAGFSGLKGVKPMDLPKIASKYIVSQRSLVSNNTALESLEPFNNQVFGRGIFSVDEEVDGVVRRVPLVMRVEGVIKPTLSLEMLRVAFQGFNINTRLNQGGIAEVNITHPIPGSKKRAKYRIPTDGRGKIWVYFAEPDKFNMPKNEGRWYISASDIIKKRVPVERLQGKLAIVGTSSVGLVDIRATPIAPRLPGVEVHANLLESILSQNFIYYPVEMAGFEMIAILVAGLLLIVLVPRLGAMWTLIGVVAASSALVGTSWYLFTEQRVLLDFTFPLASTITVYFILVFSNYMRDEAEKRQVRTAFGQYLSPDLVEQLAENPDQLTLGGETKKMTLLFCDVRGFTTISETFKEDPQGLTRLINRLLTPLTNEILDRKGTIDKYMGDCIMAFWNAPLEDGEQEMNSVASAHAMFKALEELNAEREIEANEAGEKFLPLNIGIGINTGDCVVGNMGSEQRFDYSVLGDAVNLAARLEGQSKGYGVGVVLGPDTAAISDEAFCVLELDLIAVKGKTEAVRIFTTIGSREEIDQIAFAELKQDHDAMLAAYRSQKWEEAEALCSSQKGKLDGVMDDFYDIYVGRIAEYRDNPPPADWDGVFVATTK